MVKINGTTIEMTKGDTLRAYIGLAYDDGTEYIPSSNDHIRFAMKRKYGDNSPQILKDIPTDTLALVINPSDTKYLPTGDYVYDIEITFANGDVDTFINEAKFKIREEVY